MESSHRWTFVRYFGTQQVPIGMPGRTDGRTDRQTTELKTICLPISWGRHNSAGALKFMNEIPLDAHSYCVKAIETEVATIGLLSILNFNFCLFN